MDSNPRQGLPQGSQEIEKAIDTTNLHLHGFRPHLCRHSIGVRHLPIHDARVVVAVAADVVWGQRAGGQEMEFDHAYDG